ncbi:MAG: spore cortex-lytic enzyme [Firmicutes bacterium]|nr:spore cortex-lytic enzyme [Bacillota bacterium]
MFSTTITYAETLYQQGDKGQDIIYIQQKLNQLGLYDATLDGDFGEKTTRAVIAFQKRYSLKSNGIVDKKTYLALMERQIESSRNYSTPDINQIISYSMKFIGVPYLFGGVSPSGFDCSGYVQYVFAQYQINLPRTADIQFTKGQLVSRSNLLPGDLVYFTTYAPGASHVGIYIGDGKFINAQSSKGVAIANLNTTYWSSRYFGAKRIII